MLFDHFIVVDWSARSAPSPKKFHRDAIWLAEGKATGKRIHTRYFRTRQSCYEYLVRRLNTLGRAQQKVLLGFDFCFGYPKGAAKAMRLKDKPAWQAIWKLLHELIKDNAKNKNNRFRIAGELNRRIKAPLGPFWGVPAGQSGIFLGAKKDFSYPVLTSKGALEEKRLVEQRHPRMQPAWKLHYTGSVGSQSLLGIPYLYRLRFLEKKLRDISTVWPFETGFTANPLATSGAQIVYAEIWPSLVDRPGKDEIPDREQVQYYLKWLRATQSMDALGYYFDRPADLDKQAHKQCLNHEGWVLKA